MCCRGGRTCVGVEGLAAVLDVLSGWQRCGNSMRELHAGNNLVELNEAVQFTKVILQIPVR